MCVCVGVVQQLTTEAAAVAVVGNRWMPGKITLFTCALPCTDEPGREKNKRGREITIFLFYFSRIFLPSKLNGLNASRKFPFSIDSNDWRLAIILAELRDFLVAIINCSIILMCRLITALFHLLIYYRSIFTTIQERLQPMISPYYY
jgi:hypothetical protein